MHERVTIVRQKICVDGYEHVFEDIVPSLLRESKRVYPPMGADERWLELRVEYLLVAYLRHICDIDVGASGRVNGKWDGKGKTRKRRGNER